MLEQEGGGFFFWIGNRVYDDGRGFSGYGTF